MSDLDDFWSRRDPVTLFGAAGMNQSGWDELGKTFPQVASWFSDGDNPPVWDASEQGRPR